MDERRYKLFIEMFSVATGVSFLLSALLHSLIFYFWGLDFFAFATFEDVVLGGIRLLFVGGAVAILLSGMSLLNTIRHLELVRKDPDRSLRRFLGVALLAVLALLFGKALWEARGQPLSLASVNAAFDTMYLFSFLVLLLFPIVTLAAYRVGKPALFAEGWAELRSRARLNLALAATGTVVVVVALFAPGRYHSDMRLVSGMPVPAKCAQRADYSIRWIGSKAVVLECRSRLAVVLYGEDHVVFARRN